jgi:nuclear transport factor 2 (NTF2) superfamily protein
MIVSQRPPLPPFDGLMMRRVASINDLAIAEAERLLRWEGARRTDEHPRLSDLGL